MTPLQTLGAYTIGSVGAWLVLVELPRLIVREIQRHKASRR